MIPSESFQQPVAGSPGSGVPADNSTTAAPTAADPETGYPDIPSGDTALLSTLIRKDGLAALSEPSLAPCSRESLKSNLTKQEIILFRIYKKRASPAPYPWDFQRVGTPVGRLGTETPRSVLSRLVREGFSGRLAAANAGDSSDLNIEAPYPNPATVARVASNDVSGRQNSGRGGFATATLATVATVGVETISGAGGRAPQAQDLSALSAFHTEVASSSETSAVDDKVAATLATVATVGTTSGLPARLVVAAVRVCREIYRDDEIAVEAMLNDLVGYGPTVWAWLTQHFEQQLPTAKAPEHFERLITCSGCRYAEYPEHPAIARCGAGVESGLVSGGYWAMDRHACSSYQAGSEC